MATADVLCPICETTQTVSPDKYGVFRLTYDSCRGSAMGEYSSVTDSVAWRWHQQPSDGD